MDAWRDGYIYGKRDGEEGKPRAPRGAPEGYEAGYQWGQRHPRAEFPRQSAAESLAAEFGTDISEWTV